MKSPEKRPYRPVGTRSKSVRIPASLAILGIGAIILVFSGAVVGWLFLVLGLIFLVAELGS